MVFLVSYLYLASLQLGTTGVEGLSYLVLHVIAPEGNPNHIVVHASEVP